MKRLIPLLAVLAMVMSSFGQNWSIVKYGNMEYYPNDGYFFNADSGLYVGQNGAVMLTTDGAQSGEIVREPQSDTAPSWRAVDFANSMVGFAVGNDGMIFKTTDGGFTWTEVGDTNNYTNELDGVSVVDENTVYACGKHSTFLTSTDGGATWTKSAYDFQGEDLDGGVAFCSATVGVTIADANKGATWYTHDGGITWNPVSLVFPAGTGSSRIYDVNAVGDSTIVIVGYHYCIFVSHDGGQTYTQKGEYTSEFERYYSVDAVSENLYVAGGTKGHVVMTKDGGDTWTNIDVPMGQDVQFLDFIDDQTGYVFGKYGMWFKTTDGGVTWQNILDWPNVNLKGLAVTGGGKVVVTGFGGGNVGISNDEGQNWSFPDNHLTGFSSTLYTVDFGNEDIGLIGGYHGALFRTTDGGATWAQIDTANNPMGKDEKSIYAIRFLDANTVLAGGSKGYIMKSTDGGATWGVIPSGGTSSIYDFWKISSKQVIAGASGGKIFISNEAIDAFSEAHDYGSMSMRGVEFHGDNGVVVGTNGYIFHTTVAQWDTLEQVFVDPDGDDLLSVAFVNDSVVYAVGEHGKIYTSQDGGVSWEQENTGFDTKLERVSSANNKIWIAGYDGIVLMKNLGETSGLFINEFMASNDAAFADEHGDFDDWIEIYNNNGYMVNIGGMYITDDLGDPFAWQIPDTDAVATTIMPGEFLLLWADKEPEQGILHVNIKLSSGGEQIGLVENIGGGPHFIDSLTFGPQITDTSYGRMPDGGDQWVSFYEPSPGWSNDTMGVVSVREHHTPVVSRYTLSQNYPNPFNPSTTIKFGLKKAGKTTLTVYSVTGQKVATLLDKRMKAGQVEVRWNASRLATGVYFYELKSGSFRAVKKMLLVK